ncbi:MAG TPA: putative quinol monooxygenase [Polyangiaceae bacterium]
MIWVHVDIWVKPGLSQAFIDETHVNVEQSCQEPGIETFQLLTDPNDSQHFLLVEVYRDADAPAAHKQTAHYQRWRDAVEPMMQSARSSTKWNVSMPPGPG